MKRSLALAAVLLFDVATAAARQEVAPAIVLSALGDAGDEALRAHLPANSPAGAEPAWQVESVALDRLVERLSDAAAPRALAAVGYPLALLERAAELRLLAPLPLPDGVAPASLPAPMLGSPERGFVPVWFDPIVFALRAAGSGDPLHLAPPDWLPDDPRDLAGAAFEGRLLLQDPAEWNATGVWFTALALQRPDAADDVLKGLDANAPSYARDRWEVLRRLAGAEADGAAGSPPRSVAVTTLSAGLAFQEARDDAAALVPPRGGTAGLFIGVAAAADPDASARELQRQLFARLLAPESAHGLAAAAHLVPVPWPDAAAEPPLLDWMVAPRKALAANLLDPSAGAGGAPGEERRGWWRPADVREVVGRFERELRGRFHRSEAWYEQLFDAIYIVVIVLIVLWILRRREPAGPVT